MRNLTRSQEHEEDTGFPEYQISCKCSLPVKSVCIQSDKRDSLSANAACVLNTNVLMFVCFRSRPAVRKQNIEDDADKV